MQSTPPPEWIFRILAQFCPPHLLEEIEGDLTQKFNHDTRAYSRVRANFRLFIRTLSFFRPGIILRNKAVRLGRELILYQNHIATAIRQIQKNKVFSFITIFALSTSLAAGILIFQYASFELSYDKYYPGASNTYRVNLRTFENGVLRSESALSSFDLSELQRNVKGIESFTEFGTTQWWFSCSFTYRDGSISKTFNEGKVAYATHAAIDVFDLQIKSGNPKRALTDPFTMIISETAALKYFGHEDPLGKVLHLRGSNDVHDYTITAVMKDQPLNTHYRNDILLSFSSLDQDKYRKQFGTYGYIVLDKFSSPAGLQAELTSFASKHASPVNIKYDIALEPVTDIHLYSRAEDQNNGSTDVNLIYFLMIIAFVVLGLAWINYVNLSISRSFSRAKEVGVKKTAGATYRQIVNQFLSEAFVFNVISVIVAIALVISTATWFYSFVGIRFPWDKFYWADLGWTAWIAAAVFIGGMFVAGFLPARLMASIPTIAVLKGTFAGGRNNGIFRRLSVVFQFTCTIALVMAVITINRQFNVMRDVDAGIDFQRTMIVVGPSDADSTFRTRLAQLRSALQNNSIADKVFTAGLVFEVSDGWTAGVSLNKDGERQSYYVNIIDPGFIEGYGLKLLAGRNFEEADFPGDDFFDKVEPVILNKTGAARLGFATPKDAVGAALYWDGNQCRVVGVIDDYYQRSTKVALGPAIYTANNGSLLCIQLSPGAMGNDFEATVATVQGEWNKIFPENAFDYFMLADHYESLYENEKQLRNVFQFFCVLAIIISCLGLFALSLFSVNQRVKEMSIRKVLGAPGRHLIHLLTREYFLMVIAASVVALPVTSWVIEQWLSTFSLRVHIDGSSVMVPIVLVLSFAALSVGIHTVRVVMGSPTRNLKTE